MNSLVYITGHKNPDSDSICSAIAYSYFKKSTDSIKTYVPIRLGKINNETKYILDYFNVNAPQYLDNLYTSVEDILSPKKITIDVNHSINKVNKVFEKTKTKTIIVEKNKSLCGVVTPSKLNYVWNNLWSPNILHLSNTPFENIVETLEATIIKKCEYVDMTGNIFIYEKNNNELNKGDILIIYYSKNNMEEIFKTNATLIIITACDELDENTKKIILKHNKTVIITSHKMFDVSRLLVLSVPIGYVMEKEVTYFDKKELLIDVKDKVSKTRFRAFPVLDNGLIQGIVLRDEIFKEYKKNVILTDHNEYSQSIDGIAHSKILEIVDHHKAGNINSINPIYIRTEIVGCTCTIIANMYFEEGLDIPKQYAGLMLGAIISDTLLFKSPTCTKKDIAIAKKLSKVCEIADIEKFGINVLKAGASLKGKTAEDLLIQDFKEFNFDVSNFGIAQINIMDLEDFKPFKLDIVKEMEILKQEKNYDFVLFVITNVLTKDSIFVCVGNGRNKVARAFNIKFIDNYALVKGIVSRKKQIVPVISNQILNN